MADRKEHSVIDVTLFGSAIVTAVTMLWCVVARMQALSALQMEHATAESRAMEVERYVRSVAGALRLQASSMALFIVLLAFFGAETAGFALFVVLFTSIEYVVARQLAGFVAEKDLGDAVGPPAVTELKTNRAAKSRHLMLRAMIVGSSSAALLISAGAVSSAITGSGLSDSQTALLLAVSGAAGMVWIARLWID